jgi:hypothetical protein
MLPLPTAPEPEPRITLPLEELDEADVVTVMSPL